MKITTVIGSCSTKRRPMGIQFVERGGDYVAGGSFTVTSEASVGESEELNGAFKLSQSFRCKYCGNRYVYQCSRCGKFVCYDGLEKHGAVCPSCGNVANVPATKTDRIVRSGGGGKKQILIAMDVSESMNESSGRTTRMEETKKAAIDEFINKFAGNPMALVVFSTGTRVVLPFSENSDAVRRAVASVRAEGGTTSPFAEICEKFPDFIHGTGERIIVVFTDGAWSGKEEGHIARAQNIRDAGVKILAIGCAGARAQFLRSIASPGFDISANDGSIGTAFAEAAEKVSQ